MVDSMNSSVLSMSGSSGATTPYGIVSPRDWHPQQAHRGILQSEQTTQRQQAIDPESHLSLVDDSCLSIQYVPSSHIVMAYHRPMTTAQAFANIAFRKYWGNS